MKLAPVLKRLLFATITLAALLLGASSTHAQVMYFDFGTVQSGTGWTMVANNSTDYAIVDNTSTITGGTVRAEGFGQGTAGMPSISGSAAAAFPTATTAEFQDFLYLQGSGTGTITFSGLDLSKTYQMTIYAGRNGSPNRTGDYTANGVLVGTLEAAFNSTDVLVSSPVAPDANGRIVLGITVDPANTSGFAYINMVKLLVIPEPTTGVMLVSGASLMLFRRRRRA